jgi:hypothetical protein
LDKTKPSYPVHTPSALSDLVVIKDGEEKSYTTTQIDEFLRNEKHGYWPARYVAAMIHQYGCSVEQANNYTHDWMQRSMWDSRRIVSERGPESLVSGLESLISDNSLGRSLLAVPSVIRGVATDEEVDTWMRENLPKGDDWHRDTFVEAFMVEFAVMRHTAEDFIDRWLKHIKQVTPVTAPVQEPTSHGGSLVYSDVLKTLHHPWGFDKNEAIRLLIETFELKSEDSTALVDTWIHANSDLQVFEAPLLSEDIKVVGYPRAKRFEMYEKLHETLRQRLHANWAPKQHENSLKNDWVVDPVTDEVSWQTKFFIETFFGVTSFQAAAEYTAFGEAVMSRDYHQERKQTPE